MNINIKAATVIIGGVPTYEKITGDKNPKETKAPSTATNVVDFDELEDGKAGVTFEQNVLDSAELDEQQKKTYQNAIATAKKIKDLA